MAALLRAARRVGGIIRVRRQQLFELTDPADILAVQPKLDIAMVFVTEENVDRVTDFRDETVAAAFRGFLREGQLGVYAVAGGRVVGHAWALVCARERCRANGYLALRQGEACIHFCQVREERRGRNVYPAMLVALCGRLFQEAKVRRVIIDAALDNTASLRGIRKVGFRPTERRLYVQLAGRLLLGRRLTDAIGAAQHGGSGG
ncbi:MAG TPA: GNAT family N-acetyltransferase [Planctomycetota bacterium]|nr:GNAT family N-acetyltransferase [Planctomycetota bacterium]